MITNKSGPMPKVVPRALTEATELKPTPQGKRGALRALVSKVHQQDSGTLLREAMAHNIEICSKAGYSPPSLRDVHLCFVDCGLAASFQRCKT